jgi:tRNA-binding EMAP/Myf-like protein
VLFPRCRLHSKYVETIDVGEGQPRSVISGVAQHIPLSEFAVGRLLTVWINITPADMGGIKSEAIVLVATGSDGKKQLVTPPAGAKVLSSVICPLLLVTLFNTADISAKLCPFTIQLDRLVSESHFQADQVDYYFILSFSFNHSIIQSFVHSFFHMYDLLT